LKKTDFMRNKRGRFTIIYKILSYCQQPTAKTRIMTKCNLGYNNLKEYLKLLVSHDLLSSFDGEKGELYRTSETGYRFIASYEQLIELLYSDIESAQSSTERARS
jgi:predicted transcriptional regulator